MDCEVLIMKVLKPTYNILVYLVLNKYKFYTFEKNQVKQHQQMYL